MFSHLLLQLWTRFPLCTPATHAATFPVLKWRLEGSAPHATAKWPSGRAGGERRLRSHPRINRCKISAGAGILISSQAIQNEGQRVLIPCVAERRPSFPKSFPKEDAGGLKAVTASTFPHMIPQDWYFGTADSLSVSFSTFFFCLLHTKSRLLK